MDIQASSSKKISSFTWKKLIRFIDLKEHIHSDMETCLNSLVGAARVSSLEKVFPAVHNAFGRHYKLEPFIKHLYFPKTFEHPHFNIQQLPIEGSEIPNSYVNSVYIFSLLQCKTLLEFAKAYCRIITYQQCDILKYYVEWAVTNFNLSPLHCNSASSFSMEAALAVTGAKGEHLLDGETLKWILSGIKASLSFSNVKIANANNERIGNYDSVQPRSFLIDLDLNGAYAAAASMNLCEGECSWMSQSEIDTLSISDLEEEGEYSFILEVDISCPNHLMDYHNDLPPAVVRRNVRFEELSPNQKQQANAIKSIKANSEEKLVLDLHPKNNYIIYHKLLKLYIQHGIQLNKVHRVLRFQASPFLKSYMLKVMDLRKEAHLQDNKFIKNICKLMCNSIYGKFISNTGGYTDIKLCSSKIECINLAAKASFKDITILSNTCSLFHMSQGTVYYPYNVINAFLILENCKYMVYKGFYRFREHFNYNVQLVAGETDSLKMKILDPNNNFIIKMKELTDIIDFSFLPPAHELYNNKISCEMGKWKVESLNIAEYVSLKSKVFSYIAFCDQCKTQFSEGCDFCKYYSNRKIGAAGVKKSVQNVLSHEFYKQLLFTNSSVKVPSNEETIHLSSLDTRRYFYPSGESLALGHYRITDNGETSDEVSSEMAINDDCRGPQF